MAFFTTSHQELTRLANARGMTHTHSEKFSQNIAKARQPGESRSQTFHDAARYHDNMTTEGIREQRISKNVGSKAERVRPKTENKWSAN